MVLSSYVAIYMAHTNQTKNESIGLLFLCLAITVHLLQIEEAVSICKETVTPHLPCQCLGCQPVKLVWLVLLGGGNQRGKLRYIDLNISKYLVRSKI